MLGENSSEKKTRPREAVGRMPDRSLKTAEIRGLNDGAPRIIQDLAATT